VHRGGSVNEAAVAACERLQMGRVDREQLLAVGCEVASMARVGRVEQLPRLEPALEMHHVDVLVNIGPVGLEGGLGAQLIALFARHEAARVMEAD